MVPDNPEMPSAFRVLMSSFVKLHSTVVDSVNEEVKRTMSIRIPKSVTNRTCVERQRRSSISSFESGSMFSSRQNSKASIYGEEEKQEEETQDKLVVYIDGPFGSPSSHIFLAQHVVLVCTGIGVTPYASIMQSIMMRSNCKEMKIKKLDLIWVNRDQEAVEWFIKLLRRLETEENVKLANGSRRQRFLDIQVYFTQTLMTKDPKSLVMKLALKKFYEKAIQIIIGENVVLKLLFLD